MKLKIYDLPPFGPTILVHGGQGTGIRYILWNDGLVDRRERCGPFSGWHDEEIYVTLPQAGSSRKRAGSSRKQAGSSRKQAA